MGEIAIGIDLGTSFSCVSIVRTACRRSVPNDVGEVTDAWCAPFLEDGTVAVGNAARRNLVVNPEITRLFGQEADRPLLLPEEVKRAAMMPFSIVEGPGNGAHPDPRPGFPRCRYPALVIKEMKAIVENYLGEPVTRAVITCPAYFATYSARRPRTRAASPVSRSCGSSTSRRRRRSPTASAARSTSASRSTISAAAPSNLDPGDRQGRLRGALPGRRHLPGRRRFRVADPNGSPKISSAPPASICAEQMVPADAQGGGGEGEDRMRRPDGRCPHPGSGRIRTAR